MNDIARDKKSFWIVKFCVLFFHKKQNMNQKFDKTEMQKEFTWKPFSFLS